MNLNYSLTAIDLIDSYIKQEKEESMLIKMRMEENRHRIYSPKLADEVLNGWLPLDMEADELDEEYEKKRLRKLYSNQIENMEPYVEHMVNEYDYERSPIFEDEINKDLIEELTDQSYRNYLKDYPSIYPDIEMRRASNDHNVVKDLFRYMVLSEIFHNKRPRRRRNSHRARCTNPYCGYGQRW